jgi:hypothetical protein
MDRETDMMKLMGAFCEYADTPKNAHSYVGCMNWSQFQADCDGFTKVGSLLSPFHLKIEADPFSKTLWVFRLEMVDGVQNVSYKCVFLMLLYL